MGANPLFVSTSELRLRARFVVVNDRMPHRNEHCALCGGIVQKGYVRDALTRLLFCDTQCFAGHAFSIKKQPGTCHEMRKA